MKKIIILLLTAGLFLFTACEKYLDVNDNPNGPVKVSAFLYLAPMQSQIAEAIQWDARMFAYYTQNFAYYTSAYRYDQQGDPAWTSDMAQYWRCAYWSMGQNLTDMIDISKTEERWDMVGIGYALRAWGWQMLVDEHGPIVIKEAFVNGLKTFNYDTEEYAYQVVDSLCKQAIEYLNRKDGAVSQTYAAKGDISSYAGQRLKWKKMVFGLMALNQSHLSNKSSLYNAQKVMDYVDSSFVSNSDNFNFSFTGLTSSDATFFGPTRYNYLGARTGAFTVSLMNGTVFPVADPRCRIMLPPSDNIVNNVAGAQYVGVVNGNGYGTIASADQPYNLYGIKGVATPPASTIGMYMFKDAVSWPMMTYSQLQFIKAEAALRAGQRTVALTAYNNAVSAAIDFANLYAGKTTYNTSGVAAITSGEKAAFLAGVVPADANNLTMSMILCQKYVHQWAWGTLETWTDLRRFHYTDTYGTETTQVFAGFTNPTLYSTNEGKNVNRIRPRYNSEYVWNMDALIKIGADKTTYHTEELWVTKPE